MYCVVIGGRYSADVAQGGLEITCVLHFEGKAKDIKNVKIYFKPTNDTSRMIFTHTLDSTFDILHLSVIIRI